MKELTYDLYDTHGMERWQRGENWGMAEIYRDQVFSLNLLLFFLGFLNIRVILFIHSCMSQPSFQSLHCIAMHLLHLCDSEMEEA